MILLVVISLHLFIAYFRPRIKEWLVLLEQGFKQIASIDVHGIKRSDCAYIEGELAWLSNGAAFRGRHNPWMFRQEVLASHAKEISESIRKYQQ